MLDRLTNTKGWSQDTRIPLASIPDFLPEQQALDLYKESLELPSVNWREFTRRGSYMNECNDLSIAPAAQQLTAQMHSGPVLAHLERITGIQGLIPDPYLTGAGYCQSGKGHTLKRHTDFNWNEKLKLHRAISIIIYLNPNWQSQWGGALDFYDSLGETVEVSIPCDFNRCLIWKYDQLGYHGYETPLTCPENQLRTAFRFFYYTSSSKYNPVDLPHRSLYWKDPFSGLPIDDVDYTFQLNPNDYPPYIPQTNQVTTSVNSKLNILLNCYYDHSEFLNLVPICPYHIETFDSEPMRKLYENVGFNIHVTTDYSLGNGIYPIELDGLPAKWGGQDNELFGHVLDHVPDLVVEAACKKQVIITLMSPSEGYSLTHQGKDGFKNMHDAMARKGLPPNSVILADANKGFLDEYREWCQKNNTRPMISHCHMLTCFYYFANKLSTTPLITFAMNNSNSYDFNSLNKTARKHRLDHLYIVASSKNIEKGLVSGHIDNILYAADPFDLRPTYIEVRGNRYIRTLNENFPKTIDGNWSIDNPDSSVDAIFNQDIYRNSLLSFVTETQFEMPGMFITEKVFKAIAGSHPFIMLAQPGYLSALEDLGFKVDFEGIDRSYDLEKDHRKRFEMVHRQLQNWIAYSRDEKIEFINRSMHNIMHNYTILKNTDFTVLSYKKLLLTAKGIFDKWGN